MKIKWFKSLSTVTQHFWLLSEREQWLLRLHHQNILTLEEAAFYLDIDLGTLLEEVASGHLPGGKLGQTWRFYKNALNDHFSVYHGPGPDYQYWQGGNEDNENNIRELQKICDRETVQNLINSYEAGERNFSGICLNGADLSGLSLPEIDLAESVLNGIDLREGNFKGANFSDSHLQNAFMAGASLQNTIF